MNPLNEKLALSTLKLGHEINIIEKIAMILMLVKKDSFSEQETELLWAEIEATRTQLKKLDEKLDNLFANYMMRGQGK